MIEITLGILISVSFYLILEDNIQRKVFGIALLSTVINMILLVCGRLSHQLPAFIGNTSLEKLANPLPQAMILTAIVIGFGLLIFLCVLIKVYKKS